MAGLAGIVFSVYSSAGCPLAKVGVALNAIAAVGIGALLLLFILLQKGLLRLRVSQQTDQKEYMYGQRRISSVVK